MAVDKFAELIKFLRQRTAALCQRASESPSSPPDRVEDAFEELTATLEELQATEEELRHQNQELASTRVSLEAERQRYRDLFEFAPDAYLVTDAAGTIREANRTAAYLLGVEQRFLTGKPLAVFVVEESRLSFQAELNRQHQEDRVREWEVQMRSRQGTVFDAAVTVAAVRDGGGVPVTLRWLLRDISDRKRAEEQMRQIQLQNLELTEATRLQSQFLATVSHELRTPLNAILGFSQVLLRQAQNQFSAKQADMLARIFTNAENLLLLIEDTLDLSKLEAGRMELNLQDVNLEVLIRATCQEFQFMAEQKQLTLHVRVVLDNPWVVNDSTRLRQILVNLLSNAVKFTETGSIWVEACELESDAIAVSVRDTGIGIAADDIKHVFKKFRQLNQTLSRFQNGTGLGLAIADWLVRLMNGKIAIESTLGVGSTFRIELPRVAGDRAPSRTPPDTRNAAAGEYTSRGVLENFSP